MKKKVSLLIVIILMLSLSFSYVYAADFGADGIDPEETYTINEMLRRSLEDEILSHDTYAGVISELGAKKPFTGIVKIEASHISFVESMYAYYDLKVPHVNADRYVVIPDTIEQALRNAIYGEELNIAMYEVFLEYDLDAYIRNVFDRLNKASNMHLAAFTDALEELLADQKGQQKNGR